MRRVWPLLLAALIMAAATAAFAAGTGTQTQAGAQAVQQAPAAAKVVYHGNLRSRKFHRPGCRYYNCKNCKAVFNSREEAIKAGYVPCKVCRP